MRGTSAAYFIFSLALLFSNIGGTNAIWEMEMFVEQVLEKWREEVIIPSLDPLVGLPRLNLNMSFPDYLRLKGDIWDMRYEGLKNFQIKLLVVNIYYITMEIEIESALIATHNLNGTIEVDSTGEILLIGGGEERRMILNCRPSRYKYEIQYTVGEDGYITLPSYPRQSYFILRDGKWTADYGGLLDPIPPSESYLWENAHSWITTEIDDRNYLGREFDKILDPTIHAYLLDAFNKTKYEDIISNPPSTLAPEPPLPTRVEILVRPPHGVVQLNCRSNKDQEIGPKNFTVEGGTIEIEWTECEGCLTTWTCWGYWGEGVLWFWDEVWGFPVVIGFNIYGSTLTDSVPRKNNTWLIDGDGKARIGENGVPVSDHITRWDFDGPPVAKSRSFSSEK